MCRLSRNSGASTCWNPKGLSRPVAGKLYLYQALRHTCGVLANWWEVFSSVLFFRLPHHFCSVVFCYIMHCWQFQTNIQLTDLSMSPRVSTLVSLLRMPKADYPSSLCHAQAAVPFLVRNVFQWRTSPPFCFSESRILLTSVRTFDSELYNRMVSITQLLTWSSSLPVISFHNYTVHKHRKRFFSQHREQDSEHRDILH